MKSKNIIENILIKFAVIAVFGTFCYFNFFQKLDYRLYDALFHLRKEPQKTENIVLVKIDDQSILALGEWPWSRDVIGDALLRLKELGAEAAVFDVEYISPSKNGIAPSAEEMIFSSINSTENEINTLLNQLTHAMQQGYYTVDDLEILTQQLIDENITNSFINLNEFITDNMSRDNDEYFAQALQFFGKAYLTINHQDLGYQVTEEELNYIKDRMLKTKVQDPSNLIEYGNDFTRKESKEEKGNTPALNKLMSRAHNASFTNSVVDKDGVRRRMELLYKMDDKYIPQLSFGPFLDMVDSHDIVRLKDEVIVKNALNPVTKNREDIKIPVDPYGRILINWRKGSCDQSFNNSSIIFLTDLDTIENQIVTTLKNIEGQILTNDDGFALEYVSATSDLLDKYEEISQFKNYLLSKCTGYDQNGNILDGISTAEYQDYFDLRKDFYSDVKKYIKQDYLSSVLTRLDELTAFLDPEVVEEVREYMIEDFSGLKNDYEFYIENFNDLQKLYKNAVCIIGNTATSTTDNGATPLDNKFMNVGIHANVLNTLITQDFIVQIRMIWGLAIAVAISFLTLLMINLSNAKQNIFTLIIYFVYCAGFGALFVFNKYYIQFVGTILYLATDLIAGIAYRFYQSTKEKQFITQIAASFANKDTVDELRRNPEAFKTEGQKKVITALFSDVQKFSTLSESIGRLYGDEGPNKLIEILNEYLGQMSNEILSNNGTIDKYEGDAIISMFGAPDPMNTHTKEDWAYLCLDSAIRMKKVEVEFNQLHDDMFKPQEITDEQGNSQIIQLKPLQTRIGINSGEAFVGLMGSKTDSFSKLNYTMIGDTVNLASRLEGVNKAYNSWIMCSDSTWNMANSGTHTDQILARQLDKVRVVGRSTPVQLYNIIGFANEATSELKEQIEIFNTALNKYFQRDFANAGKLFIQANSIGKGDPTALVFAERCKNFIENGVPEDWDGVINMTSK